jgi:hypothetical protein
MVHGEPKFLREHGRMASIRLYVAISIDGIIRLTYNPCCHPRSLSGLKGKI